MKLNQMSRRRALQRRRKLMPEPRRIHEHEGPTMTETEVLREVPVGPVRLSQGNEVSGIGRVDPDSETVSVST
jgi:hypothetical protein